ncbi:MULTISPECIES: LPD7 domain-containing protein [Hyphomicrobiales]|uniref:LPD7 domain-containing protein n=1 Tax=Methylobacterium sp. CCH7-A2 TaxID=1768789 RepID=UPI000B030412|nr:MULTISPECIES: LPD7 domain-containing protein [Hyphomicrobiales]
MQGERQDQSEFTIERGRERDAGAGRSSPRGASSAPQGERQSGQAEFDLAGTAGRQPESGMPERLRRKYYVAEVGSGDEAKVYADSKGEYLAFKVSTDRMATRLEDANVVRDMVSVAQHRGWKEVELRGSEEFRRTAWLEASVRGLSVRGYEPDPVDRAALAFRAKPETGSTKAAQSPQTREAGASETVTIDGIETRRPIDVTVIPPESREERFETRGDRPEAGAPRSWNTAKEPATAMPENAQNHSTKRPTVTIDCAALKDGSTRNPQRDRWQARSEAFRTGDARQMAGDEAVKAARSQLVAIERALAKAVRNPALRQSILSHAKERIARELAGGQAIERRQLRQKVPVQQKISPFPSKSEPSRDSPDRRHPNLTR